MSTQEMIAMLEKQDKLILDLLTIIEKLQKIVMDTTNISD